MTLKKLFRSGAGNERDLIKKISQRNLKALESLYDKYATIIYNFILAIVHEQKIAYRLTRTIFLLIWQKASSFNTKTGNVYRWLLSISRKMALINKSISDSSTANLNIIFSDQIDVPKGKKIKLYAKKVIKRSKTVKNAFKKLPAKEQEVIRLAYYSGLNQNEIAGMLQIPLYDVKKYMRDGMFAIASSLNDS